MITTSFNFLIHIRHIGNDKYKWIQVDTRKEGPILRYFYQFITWSKIKNN